MLKLSTMSLLSLTLAACDIPAALTQAPAPQPGTRESLQLIERNIPALPGDDAIFWARTLYGEARDQSEDELRAIAHVVFNRWRSGKYGTKITDVLLFSRGGNFAFSCWKPGTKLFNSMLAVGTTELEPYRELVNRVYEERMSGFEDPTGGATHYYHPAAMKPAFAVPVWAKPALLRTENGTRMALARLAAGEDPDQVLRPPYTHKVAVGDAVFFRIPGIR